MTVTVRFLRASVPNSSDLAISIQGLSLECEATVSPTLVQIYAEGTEFAASWGVVVEPSDEVTVKTPENLELAPGLYGLAGLSVHSPAVGNAEAATRLLTEAEYGLQLVEIRSGDAPEVAADELRRRVERIVRAREDEFQAGVGLEPGGDEIHEYLVLLFVKDCLLTQAMRLGRYEATPIGGLAAGDEVEIVQDYLKSSTSDAIPEVMAREAAESKRNEHPCIVVHFPVVRGTSLADAAKRAHDEAIVLCDVLSFHRLAYPTPFAAFVKDVNTNDCRVWFPDRGYGGNLVPGGLGGEYPRGMRTNVAKAKADERLRLYLHLHLEGLLETEPESKYFRLWSLLEVMASHEVGEGDPALDCGGHPRLSKKGKQLSVGELGIEARVLEYLRRVLSRRPVDLTFRSEVDLHEWPELVGVWNRHRNCMVHQGGCFPANPALCLPHDRRHRTCNTAREETLEGEGSIDLYLRALRETVRYCLADELELSS